MAVRIASNISSDPVVDRFASWLLSPYSATKWRVRDTYGTKEQTIDFEMRMPDGRLLTEHARLYATVKEYAFWCRDAAFTAIDDAATHYAHVRALMNVAHALSLRRIRTFDRASVIDIDEIVEAARWGVDTLVAGTSRLIAFLRERIATGAALPRTYGRIDRKWVARIAGLPGVSTPCAKVLAYFARYDGSGGKPFLPPVTDPTGLSVQALGRYLFPLEQIYQMRRVMRADSLRFRPFPEGASATAKRLGGDTKRTPTPSPPLALTLLARSMSWVAMNGDAITAAAQKLGSTDAWITVSDEDGTERPIQLLHASKLLTTACYVVLASFSARRVSELEDLTRDCLRGEPGGWWLHCPIHKTHHRKELIPIPDVAAKAIACVRALTEGEDGDRLFRHAYRRGKGQGGIAEADKPASRLNDLAEMLGAVSDPSTPDVRWNWTSHQFRRFFAILYFHRYGGHLESLAHHLRHFNLDMTRRYVTGDPEAKAIFMSYEWGYTGELARSIASGARVPRSGMDKHLANLAKRIADNFRKNLQVVTPERVGAALALLMRRQGVVVTPRPWSDCCCPATHSGARRASCRFGVPEGEVGADLSQASPEVCFGCRWSAMSDGQAWDAAEALQCEIAESDEPSRRGTMLAMFEERRLVTVHAAYEKLRGAARSAEGKEQPR